MRFNTNPQQWRVSFALLPVVVGFGKDGARTWAWLEHYRWRRDGGIIERTTFEDEAGEHAVRLADY